MREKSMRPPVPLDAPTRAIMATLAGDVFMIALGRDDDGRIIAEDEDPDEKLAGQSDRDYDLVVMGAYGIGRQPFSRIGGMAGRALRRIEKDVLIVRDERPIEGESIMVCIDGSAYS